MIALILGLLLSADDVQPPVVDTQQAIPSDAVVIFSGENTDMLVTSDGAPCNWPVSDGAITCAVGQQERQHGLWTKLHFRDAQIHVEFRVPQSDQKGEYAANSGLYFHGLFELQILDSYENPTKPTGMLGAIYGISAPLANAARKPGQWQTFDIVFKAPRRNEKGEPIEAGSITAFLNGVLVQHAVPITERVSKFAPLYFRTTPYTDAIRESLLRTGCGPVQLQYHDHAVSFRNIWIRPLDDKAFVFEAKPEQKSEK